ncbi:MAG: hypothetical protein LZ161_01625 [Thaumarchaeota archaeon]|nr:hypothetical protein [Candidatus Terraquivivens yellowstonensis]MCL7394911.1 hypothetical protein [Candidatus Terraquivivens yellowstonensis]
MVRNETCVGKWIWTKTKTVSRMCPICASEISEGVATTTCPHCGTVGHKACFDSWLSIRNACPICKRPVLEMVV